jgi:hypothetical protein
MPAHDVEAQVRGWVADEAQQQSFTDEVGWMVTWDRVGVPTPQGIAYHVRWTIGLTIRTGLVHPKMRVLANTMTVDRSEPEEGPLRQGVAAVIEGLRKKRTQLKAPGNGHGPTGLVAKGSG